MISLDLTAINHHRAGTALGIVFVRTLGGIDPPCIDAEKAMSSTFCEQP